MTEKQKNQVAVQKAVVTVMEKNKAKWQSVTELNNIYEQFTSNLSRIDEYEDILQTDLRPLKESKLNSRKILVDQLFPVSSVLGVFACDRGDGKLGKLAGVKYSELEKMGHTSLVKYSGRILKTSASLMEQTREEGKKAPKHLIADYGLTSKHLEKLQGALDACSGDEARYKATRLEKKKNKLKMDRRIRENNQLLKKKIDRMIHLFRDNQKAFYNAYIKSRLPAASVPVKEESTIPSHGKPEPEPELQPQSGKTAASSEGKPAVSVQKPVKKPGNKPGKQD